MDELMSYILNICSFEETDYLKLINYLIEQDNLHEYVDTIKLKSIHSGMYIPNEAKLLFNIQRIIRKAKIMRFNRESLDHIEYDRFAVLQVLLVIYHELYHVKQTKMSDENINDTIHKIAREGIELGRRSPKRLHLKERVLYNFHYHKVLTERSAEINSVAELIKLREKKLLIPSELKYLRDYFVKLVQMGYQNNQCPCKTYYNLRNKNEEYYNLDFNDRDYNMIERVAWGFPMPSEIIQDESKIELMLK